MTLAFVEFALTQATRWPIPVASYQVNSAGLDLGTLTTPSFTPTTGEILVVKGVGADSTLNFGTPTGGGWTYTARGNDGSSSRTRVAMWTAPVTAGGAPQTVAVTATGTAQNHTIVVERWANSQLAISPALTDQVGSGAPSATNTTVGVRSVVTWCSGDWAAVDGTFPVRVYRGEAQETGFRWLTGQFGAYFAYQPADPAGAQTFGLTAPAGQTWTALAVELQTFTPVKATPTISQYGSFF